MRFRRHRARAVSVTDAYETMTAARACGAQVGQTAVEVLPAVAVEPRDDLAVELDGEAGGVTISLP